MAREVVWTRQGLLLLLFKPLVSYISILVKWYVCAEVGRGSRKKKNAPHNREPARRQSIPDQGHGVYSAVTRIRNKHAVADYDDEKKRKRVYGPRYPTAVCCDACNGDEEQSTDRDGDVQQLGLGDAPKRY